MLTLRDIADLAPGPSLGGTELSLAVVALVVVPVAVLLWRARSRDLQPSSQTKPGFTPTPPSPSPSPTPALAPAPTPTPTPVPTPSPLPSPAPTAAPPFNSEQALELCGEDEDLLRSVVEDMPAEIESQMLVLRKTLAMNDVSTLHVTAHRLKGSLLLIAAKASAAVALSIELAAREEKLADIPAKLDELDEELVRLKAAIAEYLQTP